MKRTAPLFVAALVLAVAVPAAGEPIGLIRPPGSFSPAVPAAVAAAIAPSFAAPGLGKHVAVTVVDAATGSVLYRRNGPAPVLPASTLKLVTALTVLTVLPAELTLKTSVATGGRVASGVLTGDLVLVGGGDPTLTSSNKPSYPAPARMSALVAAVRRRGIRTVTGGIVVDTSAYTGPARETGWKVSYVSEGSVAPVTALTVDGAHLRPGATTGPRSTAPEIVAGQRFAAMLKASGVAIAGGVGRGVAPSAATELGAVRSAPLSALVERMLQRSDNDLAEALLRKLAVASGQPPSFAGGAQVVADTLTSLALPTRGVVIRDGSGLSRTNRVTTDLLAAVLRLATSPDHPQLRPMLTGLPVAGFNGTLVRRYRQAPANASAGQVRAKTGTLNNVTTLAGVVLTKSGQLLVFATSADQVPTASVSGAAQLLDRGVAAAQRCGCS